MTHRRPDTVMMDEGFTEEEFVFLENDGSPDGKKRSSGDDNTEHDESRRILKYVFDSFENYAAIKDWKPFQQNKLE